MHLDCLEDHVVHVAGEEIVFREGESIWTESSYKYSVDDFRALAARAAVRDAALAATGQGAQASR